MSDTTPEIVEFEERDCCFVVDDIETESQVVPDGNCGLFVRNIETLIHRVHNRYQLQIKVIIIILVHLVYFSYFTYCLYNRFGDEGSIILLVGTMLYVIVKCTQFIKSIGCSFKVCELWTKYLNSDKGQKVKKLIRYSLYSVSGVGVMLFITIDVLIEDPSKCQSFLGILCFIIIPVLLSYKPSKINWHPVYWGFVLQFLFAIITLRTNIGFKVFKRLGDMVTDLVDFSNYGAVFLLGKNFKSLGFFFIVAASTIFMSSIVTLLSHLGVIYFIITTFGTSMSYCLNTSPVESVASVASIFLTTEQTVILALPYIAHLTHSELFALLTCGFASIAGITMGTFISIGAPANHLLAASIISAPAGLAISKLMYPETCKQKRKETSKMTKWKSPHRNALSAISEGASLGATLITAITSSMLSFVSVIKLVDALISWFGRRAGVNDFTFTLICSYMFYPLAYVMGIKSSDCIQAGSLIGLKFFTTSALSYTNLGIYSKNRQMFDNYLAMNNSATWHWSGQDIVLDNVNITLVDGLISERSIAILTYALCGYSSIFTMGVALTLMLAICPKRKDDIMKMLIRSFLGGNMASFATACVAGILFTEQSMIHSIKT